MDFSLSEEQQEVQQLAARILGDHGGNEHARKIDSQPDRFDDALWQALADAGLLGIAVSEANAGMGFGYETLSVLLEEVGRHVAAVPVIPALVAAALPLQKFADAALVQHYLPRVVSGAILLSAALLEPGNEQLDAPGTTARQTDRGWQLSGSKVMVPYANRAERLLLAARTDRGLGWFLLDPASPGVSLQRQLSTAGEPQFEMQLNQAVSTELVAIGEKAETMARAINQWVTSAWCAMALGLCDKMMRMTASYTTERQQFGVPIATFQAVGHRAADCYIDVECLRLVSQQAVYLLDQGQDATEAAMIAKLWAGDVCHRVSQAAQHLHGGIGVDRDYELFRYCLWARQIELSCGNTAQLTAALGASIAAQYLRSAA